MWIHKTPADLAAGRGGYGFTIARQHEFSQKLGIAKGWRLAPGLRWLVTPRCGTRSEGLDRRSPLLPLCVRLSPPRCAVCPRDIFGLSRAVEDDAVQLLQTTGEVERLSVGEPDVEGVLVVGFELLELLWGQGHEEMIADGRRSSTAVVWRG